MFNATAENLRSNARKNMDQGKSLLDALSHDAYDTAQNFSRRWKQTYPKISKELRQRAALLQQNANTVHGQASDRLQHYKKLLGAKGHELGKSSLKVKSYVLKAGVLYALYRLFNTSEVSQAAEKVKARIEAKPVESAVIALGIGYLIARVLR